MKTPHPAEKIRSLLNGIGLTPEQIKAAYARSIEGVDECLQRARKKAGRYNGLTAQEWSDQLDVYKKVASEVCAA